MTIGIREAQIFNERLHRFSARIAAAGEAVTDLLPYGPQLTAGISDDDDDKMMD